MLYYMYKNREKIMNKEYKVIQQVKIICNIEEDSNDILEAIQFCNESHYVIIRQGCIINPETSLPDITRYIIIAQKEM